VTGLARCVGDVGTFLEDHWGRSPLLCARDDENAFADLFSLADVDHLITASFPRLPTFRLVRNGTPVDSARYTKTARVGGKTVTGAADPNRVLDEFHNGATLVLQGLQRYWPPLTRFCRDLELELTHPVQANAYITPAGAQGLAVHYDTHDVFVLQVAGSKEWAVHDPVFVDPLPSQPWASRKADPGSPRMEIELRTGDSLYLPRGFLHSARAQKGLSAHITVGINTWTWHDVLRQVLDAAAEEPEFRRSLPAGFAFDEQSLAKDVDATIADLREWLGTVDGQAVAAKAVRRFWRNRPPSLTGQLLQLQLVDQLTDDSTLRRREGLVPHLTVEGATLVVLTGDRELRMPAVLEPAIRRLTVDAGDGGGAIRLNELSELLDEESRLVLARRLVREGVLEIVAVG
jgi:uncharacterized cupin superfamily protein